MNTSLSTSLPARRALGILAVIAMLTGASLSIASETATVMAAGKWPEPIADVTAPVTVITAKEIHAQGFHSMGAALKWVRGMFVTSDRVYSYLGIRGIQRPGDFNNKVLLAIDGHVMNGNVYGDAYMDPSLGIDLSLVDRIEILHGPASEVYGSGAALAVVNIVMRRPGDQPEGSFGARAGNGRHREALASYAGPLANGPVVSASVSWLATRGRDLFFPEFDSPDSHHGIAADADGQQASAFFGTMDWHGMRLVTKFNERVKRVPTGSFGTLFGDNRYRAYDGHDYVELSADRSATSELDLSGRAYWDRAHYHATYVYGTDDAPVFNHDGGYGDLVGSELRARWRPAGDAHVVSFGVEGVASATARMWNYDVDPWYSYLGESDRRNLVAGWARDRVRLAPDLHLTAGVRLDRWNAFDPEWSPNVGLTYRDPLGSEWKVEAARAFRAPNPYETTYQGPSVQRSQGLAPEHIRTFQTTGAHSFGALRVLLTGYLSEVSDVIDLVEIDTLGTVQYRNVEGAKSRGLESQADLQVSPDTQVRLAAALQSTVAEGTDERLTNSPTWNVALSALHDPAGPWNMGGGVRYLSPRRTGRGNYTAPAVVTDVRAGWRMFGWAELGLEVKNLFDSRFGDPASSEFEQDQIMRDPRTFFLTLDLRSRTAR